MFYNNNNNNDNVYDNDYNTYDVDLARQSTDGALSCIFSVYKVSGYVTKMKIDFLDFEVKFFFSNSLEDFYFPSQIVSNYMKA